MSSPSVPQVLDETPIALGVVVEEGHVVFDTNDTRQRIPVEEIIAIFPARIAVDAAAPRYILVHLHEDAASTDTPYRIASFVADTLPRELLDQHLVSSWPRHLHRDRDIHVVVSTGSGLGMASTFWTLALQPLLRFLLDKVYDADDDADDDADGGHDGYHLLVTKTAQCVKDFAKTRWAARPAAPLTTTTTTTTAASPRSETIILLSGDGGIVDLLNGTTSPSPPPGPRPSLVLVPLGTANALFHSLHKPLYALPQSPSPLVLALRTLARGTPAPLPSFLASFPQGATLVSSDPSTAVAPPIASLHGAIVASYGSHAQLVWESDTPAYRAHGAARFGMVAAALLAESHAYLADVDGAPAPAAGAAGGGGGGWGYVLATLVSSLERTFTISPDSAPLGRRLRVVRFGALGGERIMDIMKAAYDGGRHVGMDDVAYDEVEALRVTVREEDPRWRKVCVDGTIVEVPLGGSFEVRTVEGALFDVVVDPSIAGSP
ncbi:hypothetical protein VD0002_g4156 [Verticillium dahliae]|nr:hypothetical protein VD0002_g4156 [Verticillium dahliae]